MTVSFGHKMVKTQVTLIIKRRGILTFHHTYLYWFCFVCNVSRQITEVNFIVVSLTTYKDIIPKS